MFSLKNYNFILNHIHFLSKKTTLIAVTKSQELSKINLFIRSNEQFHNTLMKPSKKHGEPVKNSIEAKQKYSSRQCVVKNFLIKKPIFRRSIKNVLINYYETSQI